MAEQLGRTSTVYVSDDGGSSYVKVGEVKDPSASLARDLQDATSNDDGLWKVDVAGHKKLSLSWACNYDESDAGQEDIIAAEYSDTQLMFKFRPSGDTAGNKEYIGTFNVSSVEISTPTQGVAELSISIESSGAVTRQNIP